MGFLTFGRLKINAPLFVNQCETTMKFIPYVWAVVSWSFHWLYKEVWPDVDHRGNKYRKNSAEGMIALQPLAGGFVATPWSIKGDLKFLSDCVGMRCCTSLDPCDFCKCHRKTDGDVNFHQFNFARAASWKSSLPTADEWRPANPDRHITFRSP